MFSLIYNVPKVVKITETASRMVVTRGWEGTVMGIIV